MLYCFQEEAVVRKDRYERQIKILFQEPRFKGKHIILIGGKIFTAATGKQASRLFDRVTKDYPRQIPTLAYIPKAEALILLCRF